MDAIRKKGADGDGSTDPPDAHIKELVDEVIHLSKKYGVLTEYTAFLAREGTDLSRDDRLLSRATRNFQDRAVRTRSGWGAVNQSLNIARQQQQATLNRRNSYVNRDLERVQAAPVQQINDLAFYKRGNRWVDSRVSGGNSKEPDKVVSFGSEAFYDLVKKLVRNDRQGSITLDGEVLLEVDGETVLVK